MITVLLWLKKFWGAIVVAFAVVGYLLRSRTPKHPSDRESWRRREILKELEDEDKKDAVDTLVDRLDDDFEERRKRILSRARSIEK